MRAVGSFPLQNPSTRAGRVGVRAHMRTDSSRCGSSSWQLCELGKRQPQNQGLGTVPVERKKDISPSKWRMILKSRGTGISAHEGCDYAWWMGKGSCHHEEHDELGSNNFANGCVISRPRKKTPHIPRLDSRQPLAWTNPDLSEARQCQR